MAQAGTTKIIRIRSGTDLIGQGGSVFNKRVKKRFVFSPRDIAFCELYFKVIDKQLARGDYIENLMQAEHRFAEIRSQTDKCCRFEKENDLEHIKLMKKSFYYRMMCIYFNASCFSSAVAYHFGKFLNQNMISLKELLSKNVIKICSIGGGLPSDVVALIKVLESSIYIKDDVQVHITVIDVEKKWKKPCQAILQSMENFSKEKWKINFVVLDPSLQTVSPKVASAIKEADFVSLFKFLNQLEDQDIKLKRNLFHKLSQLVRPGSVLFLMDDATAEAMQVFQGYLGRLHGHNLLFDVSCCLHTLQLTAVKRHYDLYSKHLMSTGMCNTSFELFCRSWIRTNEISLHAGNHLESSDPQIKKAEENVEEERAWKCQQRFLCRQFANNKIPEGKTSWKDWFVTEMENQEFSLSKIQKILNAAEKDLHLRKVYAKKLMFASYQDFLEDREFCDTRKESGDPLKEEKRKNFYRWKRNADFKRKNYENCIQNLLQDVERNQCIIKAKPL